jgi:hypothetical protein
MGGGEGSGQLIPLPYPELIAPFGRLVLPELRAILVSLPP